MHQDFAITLPADTPRPDGATKPQKAARAALAAALTALGLYTLHGFLGALAWAGIFAIAIWPLYTRTRKRIPRRHGVFLPAAFTLGVALIFLVPLAVAGIQIGREMHALVHLVDDVRQNGLPRPAFLADLPYASTLQGWWDQNLAPPASTELVHTAVNRGQLVTLARETVAQASHRAVLFGFTLLALFFLFRDGDTMVEQMRVASHRAFGPNGERIGRQVIASVHGTVDGLVLVGVGEGFILGIVYALAGVSHATLLGAFTAVAAMVPFGAAVAFGIAAIIALAQGATVGAAIVVIAGFAVSFIADHFIRPTLIGGATQLPFLWVLLGILGGVECWHLLGLFLGPAIMAALILLWREWTEPGAPV